MQQNGVFLFKWTFLPNYLIMFQRCVTTQKTMQLHVTADV